MSALLVPAPARPLALRPAAAARDYEVPGADAVTFAKLGPECRREVDGWLNRLLAVARRMAVAERLGKMAAAQTRWEAALHGRG